MITDHFPDKHFVINYQVGLTHQNEMYKDVHNTSANNKAILRKLMPPIRSVYSFCYAPVTYLMEFTFTLLHGNSPPSAYIRIQSISAARGTRQTDRHRPHFIMPPPTEAGHNKLQHGPPLSLPTQHYTSASFSKHK